MPEDINVVFESGPEIEINFDEVPEGLVDAMAAAAASIDALGLSAVARVLPLGQTPLSAGTIIDAVGVPAYVEDLTPYADYALTEPGWYVFARIMAPDGALVTGQTAITGAAGYIAEIGADHVDVAVSFEVASQAVTVEINWGELGETFYFRATDLAVRNLDYRTTFYVYDAAPYAVWSYAVQAGTFAAGGHYFRLVEGEYVEGVEGTDWTAGEEIPEGTWYKHSGLRFARMARNVTYKLDQMVDCPIEIELPEIADDGHGAWFEIQMRYDGSYSTTLLPPEGVKIGTAQTQSATAGVNTVDLQYTSTGDVKMWTLLNTHSNIPAETTT